MISKYLVLRVSHFLIVLVMLTINNLLISASSSSSSEHARCHQVLFAASQTFLQSVNLYRESLTLRRNVLHEVIDGEVTPRLREAYQLTSDEVAYGIGRYHLPSQLYFHGDLDEQTNKQLLEEIKQSRAELKIDEQRSNDPSSDLPTTIDDNEIVSSKRPVQETSEDHRKCHEKLLKLKKIIGITLAIEDEGSIDDDENGEDEEAENQEMEEHLFGKEQSEEELIEALNRVPHKVKISPVSHSKQEYGPSEPAGVTVEMLNKNEDGEYSIYPNDDWIGTEDDVIEEALKFYHATV